MQPVAIRNIQRAAPELIDNLGAAGVATVHEALGRVGLLNPSIRPVFPGAKVCGSAVTILAQPGDNWMVHVAIELCQPGDVLVIGCTAENTDGMFGDLLATSALARGVRGLITDTGCRDVADLQRMNFPAWSRAVSAKGTVKNTLGCVNTPIVVAGCAVQPGDIVVADDDGVVVVPRGQGDATLKAANERLANEEMKRVRLENGESGLDMYNMRPGLEQAGLIYHDSVQDWLETQS